MPNLPRTALVVIATTPFYWGFANQLIESAKRFFVPHDVILFTDNDEPVDGVKHQFTIQSYGFPEATLYRYHTILTQQALLAQYDFVFYADADMLFLAPVHEEDIFANGLVVTKHPGDQDYLRSKALEKRPEGAAYIETSADTYYCGGFNGGTSSAYLKLAEHARAAVDADAASGLVAPWHDESHLNCYATKCPPARVLSQAFCYPESYRGEWGWAVDEVEPILMARNKDGKSNSIMQSLWIGDRLSEMERLTFESYIRNGHELHLYTYGPVSNVPAGVHAKDANEIIPWEKVFKVRDGYSSFSDFFRWKVILEKGGWWVDADAVCLRNFDLVGEYVFIGGHGKPGTNDCITSGMFRAPKRSPIMEWGWAECQKMDPATMTWGQAGPPLFTQAVETCDLKSTIVPGKFFFPVFYTEAPAAFIAPEPPAIPASCYSVHLFNEMWRLAGMDKDAKYPASCLYEQLKRKFGRRFVTTLGPRIGC